MQEHITIPAGVMFLQVPFSHVAIDLSIKPVPAHSPISTYLLPSYSFPFSSRSFCHFVNRFAVGYTASLQKNFPKAESHWVESSFKGQHYRNIDLFHVRNLVIFGKCGDRNRLSARQTPRSPNRPMSFKRNQILLKTDCRLPHRDCPGCSAAASYRH